MQAIEYLIRVAMLWLRNVVLLMAVALLIGDAAGMTRSYSTRNGLLSLLLLPLAAASAEAAANKVK